MNRYQRVKKFIVTKLQEGLPVNLHYHNIHHVLDVLQAAEYIGEKEGLNYLELELLRIAVLFHDAGYIINSQEHEKLGSEMAARELPDFGYQPDEIETICKLIMATRFPHHPESLLEEIICDADLDYLGRDDFFEIGNNLFNEMNIYSIFSNEKDWYLLQEKFLTTHRYFTKTSRQLREPKKKEHLKKIRELLQSM